ncbi:uncharacterized protein LOC108865995 [Pyrus x bretschneideri]|uniref:uncharacterized protein LOC108865995 n=1 Tax=Pyrus x bretschneideri TaxID=225117 RepID=UPI00202F5790|nr:uncharacterized protein LOC108865995 [Pyrus x bretschneideri]
MGKVINSFIFLLHCSLALTTRLVILLWSKNSKQKGGENNQQVSRAMTSLRFGLLLCPSEYPLSFSVSFLLQLMPIHRHPGKALEFFTWGRWRPCFLPLSFNLFHILLLQKSGEPPSCTFLSFVAEMWGAPLSCTFLPFVGRDSHPVYFYYYIYFLKFIYGCLTCM